MFQPPTYVRSARKIRRFKLSVAPTVRYGMQEQVTQVAILRPALMVVRPFTHATQRISIRRLSDIV